MRYLKYVALLAIVVVPLAFSQAEVRWGVGIGVGPGYIAGPPVCEYGYYDYSPYACAPYGYYGPEWFSGGVFIGAGPWYRSGWGHSYYDRDYDRGYNRDRFYGRGYERGYYDRGGYRGGYSHGYIGGEGFRGGRGAEGFHGGGGFDGGGGFHGGGSFHGGGGSHGGGGHR